jgi:hypothetical protein
VVKEALAAIDRGGYAEAFERIAALVAGNGEPLPLHRLQSQKELLEDYRKLLPQLSFEQRRLIRGEQDIIVRYEAERALASLPQLLSQPRDRQRMLMLLETLLADERFLRGFRPTDEQLAMLERIRVVLDSGVPRLAYSGQGRPSGNSSQRAAQA